KPGAVLQHQYHTVAGSASFSDFRLAGNIVFSTATTDSIITLGTNAGDTSGTSGNSHGSIFTLIKSTNTGVLTLRAYDPAVFGVFAGPSQELHLYNDGDSVQILFRDNKFYVLNANYIAKETSTSPHGTGSDIDPYNYRYHVVGSIRSKYIVDNIPT